VNPLPVVEPPPTDAVPPPSPPPVEPERTTNLAPPVLIDAVAQTQASET
jgi:hypothetical protein